MLMTNDETKFKLWQTASEKQNKMLVPPPQEDGICGYVCPDCKKQIGGEIVRKMKKGLNFKEWILWECDCGYRFAEVEEGKELLII